jgi:hypothetical protein
MDDHTTTVKPRVIVMLAQARHFLRVGIHDDHAKFRMGDKGVHMQGMVGSVPEHVTCVLRSAL